MLSITIAMVVIVGVAGLVIFYVAYPHRGAEPTSGGWLHRVMTRVRDAMPPTLSEEDGDAAVRRRPEDPHTPA